MSEKKALLIFAKEPIPGAVKTRLIPALGVEAATQVYENLLHQTLETASKLLNVKTTLFCHLVNGDGSNCKSITEHYGFNFQYQAGKNLGDRMYCALKDALQYSEQAIIIGTDCPGYNLTYLQSAFDCLDNHDAVIGPASDGGYVLIGAKKADPILFEDISWSTNKVYDATRKQLDLLDWHWTELNTLNDVDEPADLIHVQQLVNNKGKNHSEMV